MMFTVKACTFAYNYCDGLAIKAGEVQPTLVRVDSHWLLPLAEAAQQRQDRSVAQLACPGSSAVAARVPQLRLLLRRRAGRGVLRDARVPRGPQPPALPGGQHTTKSQCPAGGFGGWPQGSALHHSARSP